MSSQLTRIVKEGVEFLIDGRYWTAKGQGVDQWGSDGWNEMRSVAASLGIDLDQNKKGHGHDGTVTR